MGIAEGVEEGVQLGFSIVALKRVVWPSCWLWSLSAIVGAPRLLGAVEVEVEVAAGDGVGRGRLFGVKLNWGWCKKFWASVALSL